MSTTRSRKPPGGGRTTTTVVRTDARSADPASRRRSSIKEKERRRRLKRNVVSLLLGVLFVAGVIAALFAERGYLDLRRNRHELAEQKRELHRLVEHVRIQRTQIAALENDPSAIERVAREDLTLARAGEVLLLLPRQEDPDSGVPVGEGTSQHFK